MVTREEKHSTRGRARLLFEMLEGNPLERGWRDESVKSALDLCLSCKGCRGECPVNVDIATYKAEFLSHYYHRRLRPISAYAFGLMPWWARAASIAPWLANFMTQTPGLRTIAKSLARVAPQRTIPKFAPRTFRSAFRKRGMPRESKPPVLLWVDTWNNHFHPETALAAVAVLEAAGFSVVIPRTTLCCGRPLYDYGMLRLAQRQLVRAVEALRPQLRQDICVVGLEPSCVSVFRDELRNMLPDDEDAKRLSNQTYFLTEFLTKKAQSFDVPSLGGKAVVHGHCHEKSVLDFASERSLLDGLKLDYDILDSGCCGMAGAFGFEKGDHYDVSIASGERVLLPAVRKAPPDSLIIANGFSCREQIAQTTDRRAHHIAEVLALALRRKT